jgi:heterodisulfide reductase subunit C
MEFDSPRAKLELIYEAITERIDEKEVVGVLPDCKDCIKCQDVCPHKINLVAIFQEFKSLVGFEK